MPTLYLMQGPSGSGKTAFLHRWHLDGLVVSPDAMRDVVNPFDHVAGDLAHPYRDYSPETSVEAFELAETLCRARMRLGSTVIIDSCAVSRRSIDRFVRLAHAYGYGVAYVRMDATVSKCLAADAARPPWVGVEPEVVRRQFSRLGRFAYDKDERVIGCHELLREGSSCIDVSQFGTIVVVGDVHACYGRLEAAGLGHDAWVANRSTLYVFCGDLLDRGPDPLGTLRAFADPQCANVIVCTGNHDVHIGQMSRGDPVPRTTRETTLEPVVDAIGEDKARELFGRVYRRLVPCVQFDWAGTRYLVSHAGLEPAVDVCDLSGPDDLGRIEGSPYLGFLPARTVAYGMTRTPHRSDYGADVDRMIAVAEVGLEARMSGLGVDRPRTVQIHGHRNSSLAPAMAEPLSINLEGGVERGGALRVLTLMPGCGPVVREV